MPFRTLVLGSVRVMASVVQTSRELTREARICMRAKSDNRLRSHYFARIIAELVASNGLFVTFFHLKHVIPYSELVQNPLEQRIPRVLRSRPSRYLPVCMTESQRGTEAQAYGLVTAAVTSVTNSDRYTDDWMIACEPPCTHLKGYLL